MLIVHYVGLVSFAHFFAVISGVFLLGLVFLNHEKRLLPFFQVFFLVFSFCFSVVGLFLPIFVVLLTILDFF